MNEYLELLKFAGFGMLGTFAAMMAEGQKLRFPKLIIRREVNGTKTRALAGVKSCGSMAVTVMFLLTARCSSSRSETSSQIRRRW